MRETKKFEITHFPWDFNGYKPKTTAEATRDENGFFIRFEAYETELTAVQTKHNTDIYCDSAVEVFLNFVPEEGESYINFEINPNGAMYCARGDGRHNRQLMTDEEINSLNIKTEIFADKWTAEFYVSDDFVSKFYPNYRHGGRITGNFYKTGEKAKYPHWGSWRETGTENPDFHRPESFDIVFE